MTLHSERPERIFLVGFMGSGKTTVGRMLASSLGYEFCDLDDMIEARSGKSVGELFKEEGEAEFRRLESEAVESCAELNRAVIALGGGAYVSEKNRASLRALGVTVWLDCPLEECLSRIDGDANRPLLRSYEEMRLLFAKRRAAYAEADSAVAADAPPEEVAATLARMFRR